MKPTLSEQAAALLAQGAELKAATPYSRMPLIAPIVENAVILLANMANQIDALTPYADDAPAEETAGETVTIAADDLAAFEAFKASQTKPDDA